MMTLNPISTCPKDAVVLLDVGYPWLLPGIWSPVEKKFCVAMLQASEIDGEDDPYFESDYEGLGSVKGWLPLPDIKRQ